MRYLLSHYPASVGYIEGYALHVNQRSDRWSSLASHIDNRSLKAAQEDVTRRLKKYGIVLADWQQVEGDLWAAEGNAADPTTFYFQVSSPDSRLPGLGDWWTLFKPWGLEPQPQEDGSVIIDGHRFGPHIQPPTGSMSGSVHWSVNVVCWD